MELQTGLVTEMSTFSTPSPTLTTASIYNDDEDCSRRRVFYRHRNPSSSSTTIPSPPNGITILGDNSVPVKEIVIIIFMLLLWLYSIMLIVRAWAKVHHLPDSHNAGASMWRFVVEYLQRKRRGVIEELLSKPKKRHSVASSKSRKNSQGNNLQNPKSPKSPEETIQTPSIGCPSDRMEDPERGRVVDAAVMTSEVVQDPSVTVVLVTNEMSGATELNPVNPEHKSHEEFQLIDSRVLERLASDQIVDFHKERHHRDFSAKIETDM